MCPCMNCEERHIKCHATCKRYIKWHNEHKRKAYLAKKYKKEQDDVIRAADRRRKRYHGSN